MLSELDCEVRACGSRLVSKSSWAARFGILCCNENSQLARNFIVNDIDLQIPFEPQMNLDALHSVLKRFGFIVTITDNQFYLQFSKELHGINLDLTLITNKDYVSNEFLVIRMATMEFAHTIQEFTANTKNEFIIKINQHLLKLTLPSGLEDAYIKACQFKEFLMLKPSTDFKSYSYGVYKYLVKFKICGFNKTDTCKQESALPGFINTYQLHQALIEYFDAHVNNIARYFELKDFMTKGVTPESKQLATSIISAFYFSCIKQMCQQKNGANPLMARLASQCAEEFISTFCLSNEKKAAMSLKNIKNAFDHIVINKVQQNETRLIQNVTSYGYYPQTTLFYNPLYNPTNQAPQPYLNINKDAQEFLSQFQNRK
jgi:hypothetical protein